MKKPSKKPSKWSRLDSAKRKGAKKKGSRLAKKKAPKNKRFQATKKKGSKKGHRKTTFYLVRHGATEYNALGLVQGHLNVPLLPEGLGQATACGLALDRMIRSVGATPRLVLASPVLRAEQTGRNIHAALVKQRKTGEPKPKFLVDAAFAELKYGDFTGRKIAEVNSQVNAIKLGWGEGATAVRFPGAQGESFKSAVGRFCAGLSRHARRRAGAHIPVATHSQIIEAMLVHLGALEYSDTKARGRNVNCSVSILSYDHASATLSVEAAFQDVGAKQLERCAVITG